MRHKPVIQVDLVADADDLEAVARRRLVDKGHALLRVFVDHLEEVAEPPIGVQPVDPSSE